MRRIRQELEWDVLEEGELAGEDMELRDAARDAARRAYAPFSGFAVGAAVRLADGRIVTGNNQENSAFPSGMCAERCALFAAGAGDPGVAPVAMALAAVHKGRPVEGLSPCGACRQVMMQAEERYGRPLRTLLCGGRETVAVGSVRDLLPLWGGMPLETVPAGNAGKPGQMQEG